MYDTDYKIIPPTNETGRLCANNCLLMQQNCRQDCTIEANHCRKIANSEKFIDYLEYLATRKSEGKEIKKSESYFNHSSNCDSYHCKAECSNDYRLCHSNCGGKIETYTYCTAFCE
ncbi:MAG: hypothetical protein ACOYK8_04650 [Alphaproteobacteria bacterium]